jgi:hypothetical protein
MPSLANGKPGFCPGCGTFQKACSEDAAHEAHEHRHEHEDHEEPDGDEGHESCEHSTGEGTFHVGCVICPARWLEPVSAFGTKSECHVCHTLADTTRPLETLFGTCWNCNGGYAVLPDCRAGGGFCYIDCAICGARNDVTYDPTQPLKCRFPALGPLTLSCRYDGCTLYIAQPTGPLSATVCWDCHTMYYYSLSLFRVFERPALPSTGLPPTDKEMNDARRSLVIGPHVPCDKLYPDVHCAPCPADLLEGDPPPKTGPSAPGVGLPPPPGSTPATCMVWVNCPPWQKVPLSWVLAHCNQKTIAPHVPCPPPETCRRVLFVNHGTGSPFGDEEAALEAAWHQLVEDEGVPPEAIHGCHLKPGTKITYSPKGGPSSAEVCCQVDYWCDPFKKKGNLPGGIVCCCPPKNPQAGQGNCPPPPPPPPPPDPPLPPLTSGAPRKEEKKDYCCYEANSVSGIADLNWPGGFVDWYGDTLTPAEVAALAAMDPYPHHIKNAFYLTGKEFGDTCKDKKG